jgi:hypothetical protein
MSPVTTALLLALGVPSAPAPKADKGIPKDLIDLLPEDAAAVVVLDTPKVAKSELGQVFLKLIAAEQDADEPVRLDDFVKDAELILIGQFLIDTGFGDFCVLVRLKDGSGLPKALVARADKAGKDKAPEQIGKRTVYSIDGSQFSFAQVDGRTLMLVLALGDPKQVNETRAAAYGERDKPGPSAALRKMLEQGSKDDRSVRLYGTHPTKLGHSTGLVLAPFGVREKAATRLGDKVVAYRGGIKDGSPAEVELRVTMKDGDAAEDLLKVYETGAAEKDPFVNEFRGTAKAVRDGDEVVITAKLTRAMIERLAVKPNK